MATKNAQWQAAFRQRQREAGLKAVTVWMPKEGAVRLARYPEKARGEIITRALVLLESSGELTGNDATLTGKLTGESRDDDEGEAVEEDKLNALAQAVAGLSTRLERVEATLSTITSNPTGKLTGEAASESASITGDSTHKLPGNAKPQEHEVLILKARALHAQGLSWGAIARLWNAEGTPTLSGTGQWHGGNVARLVNSHYSAS